MKTKKREGEKLIKTSLDKKKLIENQKIKEKRKI